MSDNECQSCTGDKKMQDWINGRLVWVKCPTCRGTGKQPAGTPKRK